MATDRAMTMPSPPTTLMSNAHQGPMLRFIGPE
jgi:hypothetical protein